ncbi:hypothetical protein [Actinophytocola oryzae]|uniref:Hpr(Ser) kinase/phosphatase n=1 Tax=Actinophytocola oryzae TaxID=502181 RepID=A0A4R7VD03_9PSEU|nr:hypothetical protein [Actinophytocola oryzae]TDV46895.1 hypothetical protein CLV71_11078 [Actinophytocola oryzae]
MHYRAHGLLIASDVRLPLPLAPAGPPDLVLFRAENREVPHERPRGERLAEVGRPDHTIFYTLARHEDVVLRYPGLCDFVGDAGFAEIAIHLHPGADEGLLPVLIAGALMAMHLMLRNELVLHASAVQTGDAAVAFVGKSGMGKSTLATALCALGHALVSDDLLRVDKSLMVYPGATETRLRPNARALAGEDGYETADGRLATRPADLVAGPLPLAACVIPRPSRDVTEVRTRRLGPVEALLRLSGYPRVLGWTDPTTKASAFQSLADLVERVPVLEADVPWGPPFAPDSLDSLVSAVAEECGARTA